MHSAGLSVLAAGIEDESGFGGDADEEWPTDDAVLDDRALQEQQVGQICSSIYLSHAQECDRKSVTT